MKIVFWCLLFILAVQILAAQRPVFLRVYNLQHKKIGRGFIYKTTDSSVMLSKRPTSSLYREILASSISIIRTKHSVAGRIAITSCKVIGYASLVGIVIIAAAIAANNPYYFRNGGGGGSSNPEAHSPPDQYGKPLKTYTVNGSAANWLTVRASLDTLW